MMSELSFKDKIVNMLTGCFGIGNWGGPTGTWASLAALPFAYFILYFFGMETLFIASIIVFFIGLIVCDMYVKRTGEKDPSFAVIDEVVGQWFTLVVAGTSLVAFLIGFLLFRFFDITKIQPAKKLEALEGGLGIMADDVAAGAYAALCLYGLREYADFLFVI